MEYYLQILSTVMPKQYLSTLVQSCKIHGLLAVFVTQSDDAGLKLAGKHVLIASF